jgi:hypothetical protein
MVNEREILGEGLPRLGGNWAWAFFLSGLLLPFRQRRLRRLRYFLVGSLGLLAVVQALGQTYLSAESPEINTENLLVLLAPLVLVFGTGFFFVLLDHMAVPLQNLRALGGTLFVLVMCAPLFLAAASRPEQAAASPYVPSQIQRTALMMEPGELMMSDIPWAVAWYGARPCAWLTLDDTASFEQLCRLKPVQGLYLTERTTDRPFLTQILANKKGWGSFLLDALTTTEMAQGAMPKNFPLTKARMSYMPVQTFVTDKVRWKTAATN